MTNSSLAKLEAAMAKASTYADWSEAAIQYDAAKEVDAWKESDESKYFDHASVRNRFERLTKLWKKQDNQGLLYALNEGIHGNMDGMGHDRLYEKAKFGTKTLIEDYVEAITRSLEYLAGDKVKDVTFEDKLDFFRRAQHCYGRSAFLMSGSGVFLFFHLGVVKALWQEGLLPHIMSGSSGGSVVGAMLCTHKDDEIEQFFDPKNLVLDFDDGKEKDQSIWSTLFALNATPVEKVRAQIADVVPDLTFQEAYELTGRHLNVSIAPAEEHQTSRLLNAIASPNVYIREAVFASCAVPGVYPPVTLAAKDDHGKRVPYLPDRKWCDGSVTNDLPVKRLARLYGANHFLVSQANPLAAPFALDVNQQRGAFGAIRNATTQTAKAWINAQASIWQRPLSQFPQINSFTNLALSIINQNYTGDINFIRPPVFWPISKMLSSLSLKDITYLIDLGERSAWPKIEQVRTQTKVSRALEQILAEYETELVEEHESDFALKRRIA